MDGWMNGLMDGWIEGWKEESEEMRRPPSFNVTVFVSAPPSSPSSSSSPTLCKKKQNPILSLALRHRHERRMERRREMEVKQDLFTNWGGKMERS